MRTQKDGEPIEKCIRGLYKLTENDDFPQKNNQIRDRLVIGLRSKGIGKITTEGIPEFSKSYCDSS